MALIDGHIDEAKRRHAASVWEGAHGRLDPLFWQDALRSEVNNIDYDVLDEE